MIEKILERLEAEMNEVVSYDEDDYYLGKYSAYGTAISIVQEVAKEYEECYKDCGQCEAYNKEKHHCPKFCKVIKEAVKEIEENNADRWIPCDERLPSGEIENLEVTLRSPSGNIRNVAYFCEGKWYFPETGGEPFYEVIAWKEKSAPYQKGE